MNVKPGDLAYVSKSADPSHIGAIVEVVSFYVNDGYGNIWRVRFRGEVKCVDTGKVLRGEAGIYDCCLTPISGVPVNDEVTDGIKEPA